MTPPAPPAPSLINLTPALLDRFEVMLDELIGVHQSMLRDTAAHRAAIAAADQAAIARALAAQQAAGERLAELQRQRHALIRTMLGAPALPPLPVGKLGVNRSPLREQGVGQTPTPNPRDHADPASVSVTMIVAAAPQARRAGLINRGESLRELVTRVADQRRVVRMAADSLLAHMQGLIVQIGRHLSHSGTYTRPNTPPPSSQVLSALDMTS